jgi:hypothetical protein
MNKLPLNKGATGNSAVDLGRRDTLKAIGAGTMAAGTSLIGSGAARRRSRRYGQCRSSKERERTLQRALNAPNSGAPSV